MSDGFDALPRRQTNTHTYFRREPRAVDLVRERVFAVAAASKRTVTLWCVGCSSGEEPYSLAMAALEVGADVRITASDVNPDALAAALRGRYPERALRHVDEERRRRFFRRIGGEYEVVELLRGLVTVVSHDVTSDDRAALSRSGPADFDVVFCRNVFIYHAPAEIGRAVRLIARCLKPDGFLVLGTSEWLGHAKGVAHAGLELATVGGVLVYRQKAELTRPGPRRLHPVTHGAEPRPARATAPQIAPLARAAPAGRPQPRRDAEATSDPAARARERGATLLDRGDPAAALAVFLRGIEAAPLAADLHLSAGVCHLRLGDDDDARESLRRALFLSPDLWPAAFLLGELLEADHPRAAAQYFAEAYAILSRPPPAADDPVSSTFAVSRTVAREATLLRLARLEAQNEGGR